MICLRVGDSARDGDIAMQSRSGLVSLYRLATRAFEPFAGLLLRARLGKGKEDADRLGERKGFASATRQPGALVWLHGASVGEALSLAPLANLLRSRGLQIVFTTGTVTSAEIVKARLPSGIIHQYAPLDTPRYWRRFLGHWRPGLAIIAESELWPNMLLETRASGTPLVVVNGRMSDRSMRRWSKAPKAAAALMSAISLCLTQTEADAQRFFSLGAPKVQVAGNLKFDAAAPPVDNAEHARLAAALGSRPVWLAASTHAGEDDIAIRVHDDLVGRWPDLTTIIVPRHPERGADIAALASRYGYACRLRSRGESLEAGGGLYIADTIGETGLFYRLCGIVFMGRSLAAGGGQNPIEPAKLGSAILHGPDVGNFHEVYDSLHEAGGALTVADAQELSDAVDVLLGDPAKVRALARAAQHCVEEIGGATGRILLALEPYLMRLRMEQG